jgi:antitoxin component YwqK of YwqJK toxin-antitoxin module
LGLGAALALGCAYSKVDSKIDRQPEVDMGAGATILMPGQGGPAMPPPPGYGRTPVAAPAPGQYPNTYPQAAPQGAYGQAPGTHSMGGTPVVTQQSGPTGGSVSSQNPAPGGHITMLGGSNQDMKGDRQVKGGGIPIPLAIVAAPFKKAYDFLKKDEEPAPQAAAPQNAPQSYAPPPYQDASLSHEQAQLEALDRAIQNQAPQASAPQATSRAPRRSAAAPSGGLTIAQELAALQRRRSPHGPGALPDTSRAAPGQTAAPSPTGVADRVGDRNQDGRPDYWEYRDRGHLVRELFDENADGRADRTVHYDPSSGLELRAEEDTDLDGSVDSWIEYRDGVVSRRRNDTNGDGEPDAWMFYREGQIARHEQDVDGDGFRDRVGHYDAGHISREEADNNGDGRPDVVTYYDEQEQVAKRDEDTNGDGSIDIRSYYEHGRLSRREVVSEELLDNVEPAGLTETGWDDGASD